MNREEILKKAQEEKLDEMELQIKDRSMLWSYVAMVISAAIFSFIRSEQGLPMMDLTATVSFAVSVNHIYRFIKTKEGSYLFIAIITICIAIFATIRFLMGH